MTSLKLSSSEFELLLKELKKEVKIKLIRKIKREAKKQMEEFDIVGIINGTLFVNYLEELETKLKKGSKR